MMSKSSKLSRIARPPILFQEPAKTGPSRKRDELEKLWNDQRWPVVRLLADTETDDGGLLSIYSPQNLEDAMSWAMRIAYPST
jgi:hypothetical protein